MHCTIFGIFCCNSSAHVLPVGLAVQVAKHKKKHRTRLLWQVALVPKNCLAKPYSAHKATRLQRTATRACCSGSQTQKNTRTRLLWLVTLLLKTVWPNPRIGSHKATPIQLSDESDEEVEGDLPTRASLSSSSNLACLAALERPSTNPSAAPR